MYPVLRWLTPLAVIAMVAAYYLYPPAFLPVWALNVALVPVNLALWLGDLITAIARRRRPA
ncbi:MAG: hypothetical protein KDA53_05885 [Hyphomonas sp.]|nr:hypothetical protein [Hyphomonas sp.]